jgi:hypothetical protein
MHSHNKIIEWAEIRRIWQPDDETSTADLYVQKMAAQ